MKLYHNGEIVTDAYLEDTAIMGMDTINPKLSRYKAIRVEVPQGGEGPKAHVHVYWKDGNVSYIDLTAPMYAEHHHGKAGIPLTRDTRDEFVKIMSTIWNKYAIELFKLDATGNPTDETHFVKATGYEAAVQIWIDTYDMDDRFKFNMDGRPIMPDYSKIPLEFPKS